MSDASKIKDSEGTLVNIKDAQARADIVTLNSSLTNLEQRETSETNPITQTIKPYGTFAPISGGANAVAFKFAIQNKVLFIQCFDENGTIITTLRATLT